MRRGAPALPTLALDLASTPRLGLVLDFDGTLVPIAPRHDIPRAPAALRLELAALAALPGIRVAILSGRSLEDLRDRVGVSGLWYGGHHGAEFLDPRGRRIRRAPEAAFRAVQSIRRAMGGPLRGILIEEKGLSVAVHYRGAAPWAMLEASARVAAILRSQAGRLEVKAGRCVWELRAAGLPGKADGVRTLRRAWPRRTTFVVVGDDVTDLEAFSALRPSDVSIGVGPVAGPLAAHRLSGPARVLAFLRHLRAVRRRGKP